MWNCQIKYRLSGKLEFQEIFKDMSITSVLEVICPGDYPDHVYKEDALLSRDSDSVGYSVFSLSQSGICTPS